MATRMLIDARHPEETRVAVLKGNRIEEFDFESAEHKQIKGNIYLAKVTRVEPSLQAAFVDFGGNRHGFLAFSEIHPDYYQIPAEDRARLLAEEQAAADAEAELRAAAEDEDDALINGSDDYDEAGIEEIDTSEKDHVATIEDGLVENGDEPDETEGDARAADQGGEDGREEGDSGRPRRARARARRQGKGQGESRAREMDELRARRLALRRRYKIQDVIQRRQVLLVQVVKEERGNKGAALTTYLSLAGRYCVLMPNSSHGGGISRKISSGADRKRLKQIVAELNLPKTMGLIVRTAGLQRTKTEIRRDFDYLARLWDEIRERTLQSSAPCMIHSDSDLIKRAIRDIYNREIEEVVVEGEEGYRSARAFMKLLMPSHARRVKHYADPVPLFQRYGAEDQLTAMYDPVVQLKSGGYLVINPTEALVSIDINSGRSTKEHSIEQTALATNLEAAAEIARQLRLRDMAGLIVIDFIDMESNASIRKVERAMKEALKNDRARIQIGRISSFGLMEMSRQRLRTGVLEATTRPCPHCNGTGLVRTASSAGLSALRLIEDEAAKGKGTTITLYASTEASIYLLNNKRADLSEIEKRYGVTVVVQPEGEQEGAKMRVASTGPRPLEVPRFTPIIDPDDAEPDEETGEGEAEEEAVEEARTTPGNGAASAAEEREGRRRRRRRKRGGRHRQREDEAATIAPEAEAEPARAEAAADPDEGDEATSPRKRRRRGGRNRKRASEAGSHDEPGSEATPVEAEAATLDQAQPSPEAEAEAASVSPAGTAPEPTAEPAKRARRAGTRKGSSATPTAEPLATAPPSETDPAGEVAEPTAPRRRRGTRKANGAALATSGAGDDGSGASAGSDDAAALIAPVSEPAQAPNPTTKPAGRRRRKAASDPAADPTLAPAPDTAAAAGGPVADQAAPPPAAETAPAQNEEPASPPAEPRKGWWQRTFGM